MIAAELDEEFDQFPDGLSVLTAVRDDHGTIVDFRAVYANAALERISGMRIADIVDHRLLEFVPAFRDLGLFDAYRRVVETGAPWEQEVAFDGIVGGAVRLLGHERAEIVSQYVRTLVRDEDFETQNTRFGRVLAGERVERTETQWVRKDGGLLDVVLTASPLRDRGGEVVGGHIWVEPAPGGGSAFRMTLPA